MPIEIGDAVLTVRLQDAGFNRAINLNNRNVAQFGQTMRVAGVAITAAGAAITAGLGIAVKQAASFEQAITNAAVVTGKTGEALQLAKGRLDDLASTLGQTTVFTANQAAGALGILARKGFDVVNFSVQEMQPFLDLAAATMNDLTFTTDVATSTMKAFGLATTEVARITDVFVLAANTSALSMQTLGEAMKFAAPIAAAAGVSLEETVSALAQLAEKGTTASIAGTGLRRAITTLLNPTGRFGEIIGNLGVGLEEINLQTNSLATVLKTLKDAGLTTGQAMEAFGDRAGVTVEQLAELGTVTKKAEEGSKKFISTLSGSQAKVGVPFFSRAVDSVTGKMEGLNVVASDATGRMAKFTASLMKAAGVSRRTAEEQLKTLIGRWTLLKSALESVAINIGKALLPMLTEVANKAALITQRVSAWIKANSDLTAKIVKWAGAIGLALLALGPLLLVLPGIVAVMNPFGVAILAILGGMVVFAKQITTAWKVLNKEFPKIMANLTTAFFLAVNSIKLFWFKTWPFMRQRLIAFVKDSVARFEIFALQLQIKWLDFQIFFEKQLGGLIDTWKVTWKIINTAAGLSFDALFALIEGRFPEFLKDISKRFSATWQEIKKVAVEQFDSLWEKVRNNTRNKWREIGNDIKRSIFDVSKLFERLALFTPAGQVARLSGFQKGGFTSGAALVGERGPEIIRPPEGSRVFSNSESRALAGGGAGASGGKVEINININGVSGDSGEIANAVSNAILQLERDGLFTFGALA